MLSIPASNSRTLSFALCALETFATTIISFVNVTSNAAVNFNDTATHAMHCTAIQCHVCQVSAKPTFQLQLQYHFPEPRGPKNGHWDHLLTRSFVVVRRRSSSFVVISSPFVVVVVVVVVVTAATCRRVVVRRRSLSSSSPPSSSLSPHMHVYLHLRLIVNTCYDAVKFRRNVS